MVLIVLDMVEDVCCHLVVMEWKGEIGAKVGLEEVQTLALAVFDAE